ncbi:MAG: SGNH/GDSL hydrolase family protein, partial [Thermodesulfobacteriota bacterium]
MGSKLKTLILLIVAILVGFISAEIVTRLVFSANSNILKINAYQESERGKFTRYDPTLGWAGKENTKGEFMWIDSRNFVVQNRYGFRGKEYDFKKNKKRRALVLGDSYTWGYGVEEREIYTSVMEERSGNSVEVVNTGVSGYGTDQELLFWRDTGHKWQPDDVVLMITFLTDLGDNRHDVRYGYPKPLFKITEGDRLKLTGIPVPKSEKSFTRARDRVDGSRP